MRATGGHAAGHRHSRDGTSDTPATPDTPTAGAGNGGAGCGGGTQTAAGDGAAGSGVDAGWRKLASAVIFVAASPISHPYCDSTQGDCNGTYAASSADFHSAQLAELSNVAHQYFDNHLWG